MNSRLAEAIDRHQTAPPDEDEGTPVRCDGCDAVEYVLGEISEETLEDAGWYLGPCSTLCDECNEEDGDED